MTSLDASELLLLESLPNSYSKKRIIREFKDLNEMCSLININKDDKDIYKQLITIRDNINNLTYIINYDSNYPFKPPILKINNRPYIEFLQITNIPFTNYLKKNKGIHCLSCSSILCVNNWSPACTTIHIINEIRKFKDYKRDFINKIMADKIKKKYLIDDIDLESWLF